MEFVGNFVNTDDVFALARQLRRRPRWVLSKFMPGQRRRVQAAWAHTSAPPVHFWDIPEVVTRRAAMATGDPALSIPDYTVRAHLSQSGLRGVSIGCGDGGREAVWARTGAFVELRCYDISPDRIDYARRRYAGNSSLQFEATDAYEVDITPASVDVVLFEDALHHLAPVSVILDRCREWLRPGGHLIVNEYVGARRFQYTDRQLEAANGFLASMPETARISYRHGSVKRRVKRPSRLRMRLVDPSEAIESDRIVPEVEARFDIIERRELGGCLVNLVVDDIAQHFTDGRNPRLLEMLFATEDELLATGEMPSDYIFLVARRR